MANKKIKISSVKRAAHLKNKKNPISKQQLQKLHQSQQKAAYEKGQYISLQKGRSTKHEIHINTNKKKSKSLKEKEANLEGENPENLLANVSDMLDLEDLELLHMKKGINKSRKRKYEESGNIDDAKHAVGLEEQYVVNSAKELENQKLTVDLLPIKSHDGRIITRTVEMDYKHRINTDNIIKINKEEQKDEAKTHYEDSDDDVLNNNEDQLGEIKRERMLISTTDLLIARQQEIERQKYRVGIICSGILEKPENKIRNFNALFDLMDEHSKTGAKNLFTVRKLVIISLTEVFKDILPEYRVGQVDIQMQKVRKATLERVSYENALLQQFKKFLQRLECFTATVNRRSQGQKTPQAIKMAEIAVQSLCELLMAHPYFNYVKNIAQLLVYMLNCNYSNMRENVNQCFRHVFANDKKLDITLFIVRRINHLVKSKQNNVHVECITCLLALKVKNVNLNAEKENELRQKKLEGHRQRLLNLSKKERKRRKRLAEVNKELEETLAEENKQNKHHKLTEIVKMMFTIYFRVLKSEPNSRMLSTVLEGLAEFAHVINIDFFADLIDVLNNTLETQKNLSYRDKLHCIQTIFIILSGQGEILNIDPIRFYQHFYRNLLTVHAGKNHEDIHIILKTLDEVLVKRRRNMSQQRLMAFVKRIMILSLHLLHHGTLSILSTVKTTFQLTSILDVLLDTDCTIGSGFYDAYLEDPEYCNASCSALYELIMLSRHYHPTVRKVAYHIASGVPATGDGSLPSEIGKLTPFELFEQYNSIAMAFNPTIPIPKPCEPKIKKSHCHYLSKTFLNYYNTINGNLSTSHKTETFNFYDELQKSYETGFNLF